MWIWIPIIILGPIALIFLAGRLGLLRSSPPADLGVREGLLKAPSMTENSVSSQAALHPEHPRRGYAEIEPIHLLDEDGPATLARIREVLQARPDVEVGIHSDDYLHAQFVSKRLQFVDDAEFWFDPKEKVIHVRSAARLGRRDFGMNRQHIEEVRGAL